MDVLEKHHGKLLKEEFLKKILPVFYRKAVEENKILPAGLPKIYDIKLDTGNLSFSAEFESRPEIELKESSYKGIKIKNKVIAVKDSEIEKVLSNLKEGVKKISNKDLDDESLARWAAYPNFAELREAVKGQLYVEKLRERRQKIDNQIKAQLLAAVNIDLPKSEVERHRRELVEREIYNLRMQGIPAEDIEKYRKDVEEKLQTVAEEEIKLFYILEAIANNEGIKIDNNLAEIILGFILSHAQYES